MNVLKRLWRKLVAVHYVPKGALLRHDAIVTVNEDETGCVVLIKLPSWRYETPLYQWTAPGCWHQLFIYWPMEYSGGCTRWLRPIFRYFPEGF